MQDELWASSGKSTTCWLVILPSYSSFGIHIHSDQRGVKRGKGTERKGGEFDFQRYPFDSLLVNSIADPSVKMSSDRIRIMVHELLPKVPRIRQYR